MALPCRAPCTIRGRCSGEAHDHGRLSQWTSSHLPWGLKLATHFALMPQAPSGRHHFLILRRIREIYRRTVAILRRTSYGSSH